jgi:RNA polymerase-binding transcription factor DksA
LERNNDDPSKHDHGSGTRRRKLDLESKLKELLGISSRREELQIDYMADPLDQVGSNTEREMEVRRLDHQTGLIHDIQSALAKLEDGTYGLCEGAARRQFLENVWMGFHGRACASPANLAKKPRSRTVSRSSSMQQLKLQGC